VAVALVAVVAVVAIAGVGIRMVLGHGGGQAPSTPGGPPSSGPQVRQSLTHVLLGIYLSFHQKEIQQPIDPNDKSTISFSVSQGESASTIGPRLQQQGLIRDAELFRYLVRYRGIDNQLEVGDYELSRSMTMEQIVTQLQRGSIKMVTITIPEGWRMEQIAQALADAGLGKQEDFLALMRQSDYRYTWLQDRPQNAPPGLEGFLFPDTYRFRVGTKPADIIDIMLKNFDRRVTPQLRQDLTKNGLSFYQSLVLASIVEREAMLADERPLIASVFYQRLAIGMPLQSDPTVVYAKGYDQSAHRWWTPMQVEDSQTVASPYNTFLNPGLPPGPICNPGLAALQAVAYPSPTRYLYFVAKGDGSHAFAETYEEHLENVEKYQH